MPRKQAMQTCPQMWLRRTSWHSAFATPTCMTKPSIISIFNCVQRSVERDFNSLCHAQMLVILITCLQVGHRRIRSLSIRQPPLEDAVVDALRQDEIPHPSDAVYVPSMHLCAQYRLRQLCADMLTFRRTPELSRHISELPCI